MFIFSFIDRSKLIYQGSNDVESRDLFSGDKKDPEILLKDMLQGSKNINDFDGKDYELVKNHVRWGDALSYEQLALYNLDGESGVGEKDLWLLDKNLEKQFLDKHVSSQLSYVAGHVTGHIKGDVTGDGVVDDYDITVFALVTDAGLGVNPLVTFDDKPGKNLVPSNKDTFVVKPELIKALDLTGDGILNGNDLKEFEDLIAANQNKGRPVDPLSGAPGRPIDPNVLLGDLTGAGGKTDGKIDFRDVEILAQALNQDPRQFDPNKFSNADMDGDGKVNRDDLRKLVSKARETAMKIDITKPKGEGDINGDGKFDLGDLDTMSYASDFAALGELTEQEKTFLDMAGGGDYGDKPDGKVDAKDYYALYGKLGMPEIDLEKLKGSPSINSDKWFISQNVGFNNTKETEDRNGNCQAAAFSMAMTALGEWEGGPERAAYLVEAARYFMGAILNNYEGIIAEKVKQGANALGLTANLIDVSVKNKDADIQKMKEALSQGHKIVAGVNPALYAAVYNSGHAICLNGWNEATGKFILGDPGFDVPIELDPELLLKAIEANRGKITVIEKRSVTT